MFLLIGLTLAAVGAAAAAQPPPRDSRLPSANPATASVSGRVTVMGSKPVTVIRRARVTLESAALPQPETTDTDTQGRTPSPRFPRVRIA